MLDKVFSFFADLVFSIFIYDNNVLHVSSLFLTTLESFLIVNLLLSFFYFYSSVGVLKLLPEVSQNKVEIFYSFLASAAKQQLGFQGQQFFVFIFVLFLFILVSNIIGMVPFSFTITSHIFQTFSLGLSVTIAITIIGFFYHGLHFFSLFLPQGAPKILAPLLVFIEVVSYVSRAFSLSIRLFANMMSGHTLLNIMTGFILKMFSKSFFLMLVSLIPFFIISAIILLELGIAVLQAYVFVILFCIYLNDAYHLSH
jgi:ATP synthase subunit 6